MKKELIGELLATFVLIIFGCGWRLFARYAGWGRATFPQVFISAFTVIMLAPLLGASIVAVFFRTGFKG